MKRVFSGMQPTNQLHLGNYLGALRNWVGLQDEMDECIYCVVDLHAITQPYDPARLAEATREVAATYIAAGVDPDRSIVFAQSTVPSHAQLMWLFASLAQMGELNRMTQFKEKSGKHRERAALGLFAYPVLMAADILVYKATHVPVGEDQKQHLELTREIARTFNFRYECECLPEPEPLILGAATRVMSLRNGQEKMSKSAQSDMTRINLTDDSDAIAQKIRKAKTDPEPLPESLEELDGRPEARNLINIFAAITQRSPDRVLEEFAGKNFSAFKPVMAEATVAHLGPIAARLRELLADPTELDALLERGAERAEAIASQVVIEVSERMGFWQRRPNTP
ncbi:MAG: tryptophan--tRNA ligase [Pseudomonadota bacterium]